MSDILPENSRRQRACMLCSLIKTVDQFVRVGCENCESILMLREDQDKVLECTSPLFEGTLACMRPERSWVSKWQRIDKFVPGLYAIQVIGNLPIEIQDQLQDKGIKYRPRDGTFLD